MYAANKANSWRFLRLDRHIQIGLAQGLLYIKTSR